jgi:hypothetical protein
MVLKKSIPGHFEEYVRRNPDRVDFKTNRNTLTWAALNRAANRVARTSLFDAPTLAEMAAVIRRKPGQES